MRYVIFGDTGGHKQQLLHGLVNAGLDPATYKLPEDVTIVHLGDLVHKGPDSYGVLQLVDKIAEVNPGQWVQLLGNHEFQYIQGAPIFWQPQLDVHALAILGKWLQTGFARVAYSIDNISDIQPFPKKKEYRKGSSILLTHAGLTYGFWKNMGEPSTASEAADIINNMPVKQVSRPGRMLLGPGGNPYISGAVGPVWALGSDEVFNSWQDLPISMPFNQAHGHTNCYQWTRNAWFPGTSKWFVRETSLAPTAHMSVTNLADALLLGLDPGFSAKAYVKDQPYATITAA